MAQRHGLPPSVFTSDPEVSGSTARLKLEAGSAAFTDGRAYRTYLEMAIPNASTQTIEFTATRNTILHGILAAVTNGDVALRTLAGATSGGVFNVSLPIIKLNAMAGTPAYTITSTAKTGGTATGGVVTNLLYVKAGNGNSPSPVIATESARGVAPGTYHLTIQNIGAGVADLVVYIFADDIP